MVMWMVRKKRDVLDWTGDEVVAWTKPKWYEKLAVLSILIPMGVIFAIPPIPLRIGLAVATVVTWYFLLMFIIEDVKTWIIARRIRKAAERRWHIKYAFQTLFEKYPWLETYLREVRRAEELGFPYVPDIIVKDPATAKIEIRRPPPARWWLPQQIQPQPQAPSTPHTPPERASPEETPQQAQEQTVAPPQPRREQRRRRERKIPLPPELEDAYRAIKRMVESLSIEETHALFRIMAEMKGYGRLPRTYVASQFINLSHTSLRRYLDRGEMPTTPSRVASMQKRTILPTLRRDLALYPTLLIDTLRRFADQHPERQEEVRRIIETIMRPPEEESEEETREE